MGKGNLGWIKAEHWGLGWFMVSNEDLGLIRNSHRDLQIFLSILGLLALTGLKNIHICGYHYS